ncbi:MAG TPA: hypothetical protein VGP24_08780, partial [Glaciihabitans sp.]|nr:hypothetical protein [Glaciihabitans sp.]
MSSQIKLHGTPPSWGALTKRTIHTLTDGSCVAIVWDQNESDEITGDKDDVVDMHVYWSANRTAWTLKLTRSDTGWQGMIGVYSSFLDANNDLHVIARTTAGVVYTKLVYAANAGAPTWTFDAWETVFSHSTANLPSTCQFLDLAVANISPTIQVPIVGTIRKSGSNWLAEIHVRKTDATAGWVRKWPSVIVLGQSLYTNSNDLSIAVEAAPVSATDVRVAIMYVKIGATSGDLGDTLEIVSVNTQTGDVSGSVNRMVFDNLNQGEGNKARNCFLFATTGNNFVWGEAVGVTSGGYVCSGRVDRDGNTIIPATYSSEGLAIDRTNARWNQATAATYQDGGLNFTYVGTDGYIRNIIASRNGTTRLYFSDPTFWDNRYKLGPYYAVALYGGGSRNLDSGFRKHDSYANYGRNTSTASSREFRHQFAQVFRAPAAVRPGNGTTVDTDQPDLGIDADIDQKYPQSPMKGRWEFARDAAFTDSLRVFEQTEVFIRTGAAQGPPVRGRLVPIWYMVLDTNNAGVVVPMNDKLPATQELYSGTWYVRACYLDYFGIKHTYSPTATITVSHPPTAINLYPTGGEVKQWNGGQLVLNWGFRDTSPTD